ncbi:MAG: hypothetical protein K0S70_2356 [Microbacterium sp.]|jgi:hypothetical protein|nr:hypothetical protein [Microbacterium sp.]
MSKGRLDGVAAADRMLGWRTYGTGLCLNAVYVALGSHTSDRPGFYTYALRALETVPAGNRHYDRTPPKGAIVFFTAGRNGYGHICISVGGGNVVSTDVPGSGRVGVTSISALERAWGRRFLCWTNWVMGYDINVAGAAPASTPAKPAPAPKPLLEEDDMLALRIKFGPATHLAILGPGIFRHLVHSDNPDKVKNILRIQDDWQEIDISELPVYLRTFGCDLNIWDVRDKNGKSTNNPADAFVVLDPLTGKALAGAVWTAVNARAAELRTLIEA